MPDSMAPLSNWYPGVEVEEDAGREGAVDGAGLELERVGGEVGKVPEPGAGVVTSGAPPVMPVRRWATGVGVTSGAAWDPAATPPKGGRASVPTKWEPHPQPGAAPLFPAQSGSGGPEHRSPRRAAAGASSPPGCGPSAPGE